MKPFFLRLGLFFLPLIALWSFFEFRLRSVPNSYSAKVDTIRRFGPSAEVVILGSSQALRGIDPDTLKRPAINLANVSQTLHYDSEILRQHLNELPDLKLVLITLSYFSFDFILAESPESWRTYFYYQFFDVRNELGTGPWMAPENFSLFMLYTPRRSLSYALNGFHVDLSKGLTPRGWNPETKFAFSPKTNTGGARRLAFHHSIMKPENRPINVQAIEQLLAALANKRIRACFVTAPALETYRRHMDPEVIAWTEKTLENFRNKYGTEHHNYLADSRFIDEDFVDNDHLAPRGAQKFTAVLNSEIIEPRLAAY